MKTAAPSLDLQPSLWRLRVEVDDSRGRLAALAMTLSRARANILTVAVHPLPAGGAVDELLLALPVGADPALLLRAAELAGGRGASVWPGDLHDYVDEPTRVLRLAGRLARDPGSLPAVLAELLRAHVATPLDEPASDDADGVLVDTMLVRSAGAGPLLLQRPGEPFTPAERSRAVALAALADVEEPGTQGCGPAVSSRP
ncbi:ACT domain-containing protein [Motilibacter peucedani]|uniref:hypothetical protein n=1 Tax=Motilibacter peucedani TaxID=598650 RepID=UPI0015FFA3C1|nr:hypothetical protein [Motilibacter peucedani]